MRRRQFSTLLLGPAIAWPLGARGQQPGRLRRVAVLMLYAESDPQGQVRASAFQKGLESAGWTFGQNITVVYLWGVFDGNWASTISAELERLAPDVIVINSSTGLREVEPAIRGKPIVFIGVSDPVARGLVASLAHPGGNMTGFSNLEPSFGAKWLELLKEIAPQAKRVGFIYSPKNLGAQAGLQSVQMAAQDLSVELIDVQIANLADIEAAVAMLAGERDGALIIPPDPFTTAFRKQLVELATRHRLPLISALRSFTDEGGLLAYGVYIPELFREAAGYVDQILRGKKPADLPVQQPTKFEMVINLKTAKALGLTVPPSIFGRADEVIE
jgi:putative ABC transport system substrate-binding protein